MFEPQGSAGTRNPTFGAPGRGAPVSAFRRLVLPRPPQPCLTLVGLAPSAEPPSLPMSPRRLPSAGALVVPRHLPSTPPSARRGTGSKHRRCAPQRPLGRSRAASSSPTPSCRLLRSSRPSWAARRRHLRADTSSHSSSRSVPLPRGRGLPQVGRRPRPIWPSAQRTTVGVKTGGSQVGGPELCV